MCPSGHDNCELQCIEGWNETARALTGYCAGEGIVMYMDGFHTVGGTGSGELCVTL